MPGKTIPEQLADYTEILRQQPDDIETRLQRGKLYMDIHRLEEAQADFSEIIRLKPDRVAARIWRGDVCYAQQQYDAAIADYSAALQLEHRYHALIYSKRGQAYYQKQNYRQAISDFEQTIAIDGATTVPDHPNYQQAVFVYAYYIDAYRGRAQARRALGDAAGAQADERIVNHLERLAEGPIHWL